jgi:hypothetical protein
MKIYSVVLELYADSQRDIAMKIGTFLATFLIFKNGNRLMLSPCCLCLCIYESHH